MNLISYVYDMYVKKNNHPTQQQSQATAPAQQPQPRQQQLNPRGNIDSIEQHQPSTSRANNHSNNMATNARNNNNLKKSRSNHHRDDQHHAQQPHSHRQQQPKSSSHSQSANKSSNSPNRSKSLLANHNNNNTNGESIPSRTRESSHSQSNNMRNRSYFRQRYTSGSSSSSSQSTSAENARNHGSAGNKNSGKINDVDFLVDKEKILKVNENYKIPKNPQSLLASQQSTSSSSSAAAAQSSSSSSPSSSSFTSTRSPRKEKSLVKSDDATSENSSNFTTSNNCVPKNVNNSSRSKVFNKAKNFVEANLKHFPELKSYTVNDEEHNQEIEWLKSHINNSQWNMEERLASLVQQVADVKSELQRFDSWVREETSSPSRGRRKATFQMFQKYNDQRQEGISGQSPSDKKRIHQSEKNHAPKNEGFDCANSTSKSKFSSKFVYDNDDDDEEDEDDDYDYDDDDDDEDDDKRPKTVSDFYQGKNSWAIVTMEHAFNAFPESLKSTKEKLKPLHSRDFNQNAEETAVEMSDSNDHKSSATATTSCRKKSKKIRKKNRHPRTSTRTKASQVDGQPVNFSMEVWERFQQFLMRSAFNIQKRNVEALNQYLQITVSFDNDFIQRFNQERKNVLERIRSIKFEEPEEDNEKKSGKRVRRSSTKASEGEHYQWSPTPKKAKLLNGTFSIRSASNSPSPPSSNQSGSRKQSSMDGQIDVQLMTRTQKKYYTEILNGSNSNEPLFNNHNHATIDNQLVPTTFENINEIKDYLIESILSMKLMENLSLDINERKSILSLSIQWAKIFKYKFSPQIVKQSSSSATMSRRNRNGVGQKRKRNRSESDRETGTSQQRYYQESRGKNLRPKKPTNTTKTIQDLQIKTISILTHNNYFQNLHTAIINREMNRFPAEESHDYSTDKVFLPYSDYYEDVDDDCQDDDSDLNLLMQDGTLGFIEQMKSRFDSVKNNSFFRNTNQHQPPPPPPPPQSGSSTPCSSQSPVEYVESSNNKITMFYYHNNISTGSPRNSSINRSPSSQSSFKMVSPSKCEMKLRSRSSSSSSGSYPESTFTSMPPPSYQFDDQSSLVNNNSFDNSQIMSSFTEIVTASGKEESPEKKTSKRIWAKQQLQKQQQQLQISLSFEDENETSTSHSADNQAKFVRMLMDKVISDLRISTVMNRSKLEQINEMFKIDCCLNRWEKELFRLDFEITDLYHQYLYADRKFSVSQHEYCLLKFEDHINLTERYTNQVIQLMAMAPNTQQMCLKNTERSCLIRLLSDKDNMHLAHMKPKRSYYREVLETIFSSLGGNNQFSYHVQRKLSEILPTIDWIKFDCCLKEKTRYRPKTKLLALDEDVVQRQTQAATATNKMEIDP